MAIFIAHRHQCSFEVDPSRLQSPDGQLHPALVNAIYLHACCFSQSPWFADLETYFLVETLSAISAALERSDRLIDVASALSLLAVYQYAHCRISEGYRHSFAAARLAINLGLHQISSPESSPHDVLSAVIPPARDGKELRDRIDVFWQVLIVDRSWSVASGLPTALPGDQTSETLKIETPLPQSTTPSVNSFSSFMISLWTDWNLTRYPLYQLYVLKLLRFTNARIVYPYVCMQSTWRFTQT
jgi:hypothetical protein